MGVLKHLSQSTGPEQTPANPLHQANPFFQELKSRLQQALEVTSNQAEDIRQAHSFLQQVEHFLAHIPRPTLAAQQHPAPQATARYKVGDLATAGLLSPQILS